MTTTRLLAAALLVGGIISVTEAQNTPPSPAPAKASANPEHERLKSDAENAYQNGEFPKAIELTSKVLAQNPKDHVALYLRASSRVELGQLRRDLKEVRGGIEDAREAMRHGGTDQINYYLPYFYGMSTLAQMENRKEHAEVVATFATQILSRTNIKPEDRANLLYQRAAAYLFQRNLDAASKDYDAAIKLVPAHVGARLGLADCYVQMQKPDLAEQSFTAAVQAVPNNPLVFNNRGMFYQQQGKSDKAIADFSRAIELDAEYAVAYTNRGFAAMAEGNLAAAENDFTAALKIDPQQPLVHSLRGTSRLSQGNAKGAIEDYNQVITVDGKNPVAHVDLGFAKYFSGDFVGAAAEFDQALTIDANLRYALPWRFWALTKAGQGAAAATKLGDALTKAADKKDWADHLLTFLASKSTEQEVINAADNKEETLKNAQLCEAFYFCGEKRTVAADVGGATQYYQQALATKQTHLSAYRGSQFALKQFPAAK